MTLHPKAAAAGLGGSLALIIVWALGYALTIPPEVASAGTVIIAGAAAWLAPWFATIRPGPDPVPPGPGS